MVYVSLKNIAISMLIGLDNPSFQVQFYDLYPINSEKESTISAKP